MPDFVKTLSKLFERQTWIDQAAKPLQNAIYKLLGRRTKAANTVSDMLNGTWLGHPLHPVLTDVPLGAWTAAVTLDAMEASNGSRGVGKAADAAVAIGVAGAVGSAVTGLADWQYTVGESRRTGFVHATINTLSLGLFIFSLMERGKRNRGSGRMLALAGYSLAAASAYLGGDLVYRQKIGVNHAPLEEQIDTEGFVQVLAADQLPENTLTKAMLVDVPLVLLRRGDRVYALAEHCSHLGGPLAEGAIKEGSNGHPVVECPWHDSHFNMQDGSIEHGPATYPQPCFDARIHDGQVEVRHRESQAI